MAFKVYGKDDLRMAYKYVGFLKTQKQSDTIKKELDNTKREIRKYEKEFNLSRVIKCNRKNCINKITLPENLSSLEEADDYFNKVWNLHNEGKFKVEIVTDWYKVVERNDESYIAYCQNHFEDSKGALLYV